MISQCKSSLNKYFQVDKYSTNCHIQKWGFKVDFGDFDSDGNIDIALATSSSISSSIRLYKGNGDGTFSKSGNPDEFRDVKDNLMSHDRFYTMADFDTYIAAQDKVNETYKVRLKHVAHVQLTFGYFWEKLAVCLHFLKKIQLIIYTF